MTLLDSYSAEEFKQIVNQSYSWADLGKKLGYNCNSSNLKEQLEARVKKEKLDISHFSIHGKGKIERTRENVFIDNSTANQTTLRKFYLQENIPYICTICGQEPFWNGKEMTLILDHINGKNHDDRLENLRWVCPNCNIQLPTTNRRKTSDILLNKKYYCCDCGIEISKGSTRCRSCQGKQKIIPITELPVTREELKQLIRTTPFTKIGEKYHISDNMVRKWCDKFDLPRRSSEIKAISDKEWSKI